ncbi:RNA-directed DNA polymerase [Striga asiatica]|uniref:RNA-directed DNA polymerase n=1 Tax=Striga asiatica TaxID=4170 RepID=A0A5A7P706_STRAF|nr:RNA-directed DNA polymerase [Striga asiatica]
MEIGWSSVYPSIPMIHVLRGCDVSNQIWKKLIPCSCWDIFFGIELDNWLEINLANKLRFPDESPNCLFRVSLWHIWQEQNNFILNVVAPLVDRKIYEVRNFVGNFQQALSNLQKLWQSENQPHDGMVDKV